MHRVITRNKYLWDINDIFVLTSFVAGGVKRGRSYSSGEEAEADAQRKGFMALIYVSDRDLKMVSCEGMRRTLLIS